MGQFKPMVKMMTTEPTVELKLKKGGHVNMKKGGMAEGGHKKMADGGGAMNAIMGTPALVGRPAVNAPVRAPGKPPMAARRKAMAAKPAAPAMKNGGESKATHKAEMSKMKGLEKELKSHESKPASKGHKGLKTGGVVNGQGGFKTGGVVKGQGGYATGGVANANGGGYKKGGSAKKAYATGGLVDTGKPVAMPQGRKKPSAPVSINQLSGTFKKGGQVKKAGGGEVLVDASKGAYDKSIGPSEGEMDMAKAIRSVPRKLFRGAKSLLGIKDEPQKGSVTETQKSVTVTPAKKRGGSVSC